MAKRKSTAIGLNKYLRMMKTRDTTIDTLKDRVIKLEADKAAAHTQHLKDLNKVDMENNELERTIKKVKSISGAQIDANLECWKDIRNLKDELARERNTVDALSKLANQE